MSTNMGESSRPHATVEQVRVALIIPEKNLIALSPDVNSGLFVDDRGDDNESIERRAHSIVGQHIGKAALSSVRALGTVELDNIVAHGYAIRPSYGSTIDFAEVGLDTHPINTYTPIDPIDQHFLDRLA